MSDFGAVGSNTALLRTIHFSGGEIGRGVTAPTDVTIGTTPDVPALLFDAVAETGSIFVRFSPDIDRSVDMTLRLLWSLVAVETDTDQLDITIDYVAVIVGTTAQGPDKASTQILATQQVSTAEGLAINDVYQMNITIAAADGTNPLASASGIALEMHLTNLVEVAAIHLLGADLEYAALY